MRSLLPIIKGKKPRHPLLARLLHWVYAPAVLAGILSGFYLTRPFPSQGFSKVESAQKTHFVAQYLLICSYLARIYQAYFTKDYQEILPGFNDMAGLPRFLQYELFLSQKKPKYKKYNPGQKILFTGLGLLIPLQIITGLALYKPNSLQKTVVLAGGLGPLRKWHYLAGVAVFALSAGHIYFACTHDPNKLKSIFTGYE